MSPPDAIRQRLKQWTLVLVALAASVGYPVADRFYLFPRGKAPAAVADSTRSSKIDKLESPVEVRSWSAEGLELADGRRMQVPGFLKLQTASRVLMEATHRGVEIATNGHLYGLIPVFHSR